MAQDYKTLDLAVTLMEVELLPASTIPAVTRVRDQLIKGHRISEDIASLCPKVAYQRYLDGMK